MTIRPEIVRDVIRDLELEEGGAVFYFAIDPHDLLTFCFPVVPEEDPTRTIDDIADEQAALYELCYGRNPPPLVLAEYADELDSILSYAQRDVRTAFQKAELLEVLFKRLRSDKADLVAGIFKDIKSTQDPKDFNIVLAVVMGIYSLGIERFQDVYSRITTPVNQEVQHVLRELSMDYHESVFTESLYRSILSRVAGRKSAARADARAIDRLLFLNAGLERAFTDDRIAARQIFLYLSSAGRTQQLFRLPELQEHLPIINGHRFSIHRTPEHVFTYIVTKAGDTIRSEQLKASIENLKEAYGLLTWDRAHRLARRLSATVQQECPVCIQDGATEIQCKTCPHMPKCQAILRLDKRTQEQRATIQNLGLMSTIRDYATLRSARAEGGEAAKFLAYFQAVFDDSHVRQRALDQMRDLQRLMRIQIDFKAFLSSTKSAIESKLIPPGRQLLYLFEPFLRGRGYDDVLELLDQSERVVSLHDRLRFYEDAIARFSEIDADAQRVTEVHELVRCVLYFICPTEDGDEMAFKHACAMLDSYPNLKVHFWVTLCWVAPRLRKFTAGEWYAAEGLAFYPEDPRLHHGRALNIIKWLTAEPGLADGIELLELAIREQMAAIKICEVKPDVYRRLLGVGYNNLAYYYCFAPWTDSFDDSKVMQARNALNGLKAVIPKEKWLPLDVNFFHTEAQVEYYEALAAERAARARSGHECDGLIAHGLFKLECALREINVALTFSNKDRYRLFKEQLELTVARLVQFQQSRTTLAG